MDLDIYTDEMAESIWDKAFFMDKVHNAKCIIDFGCADGAMIRYLAKIFPDIMFVGYDINNQLIERARAKVPQYTNNIFFGNYQEVIEFVKDKYTSDEICLNFSSVLHEVFSSTPEGKSVITSFAKVLKPKYITIRDMYWHIDRPEFNIIWQSEKMKFINKYCTMAPEQYYQFVEKYGEINSWKDTLHFLMKFLWKDNGYEQELKEDYFSWTINDFLPLVSNYKVIFENHYMLPYLFELWEINPNHHTHAQFILRRD